MDVIKHARLVDKATYVLILFVLVGLVLHAPFITLWDKNVEFGNLIARSWKEILVVILVFLRVPAMLSQRIWQNRIVHLIVAYVLLHLLYIAIFGLTITSLFALRTNLTMFAVFVVGLTVNSEQFSLLVQKAIFVLGGVAAMSTILHVLLPDAWFAYSNISDAANSVTFIQDSSITRFHGLLSGPLQLGSYLVLPSAIAWQCLLGKPEWRWVAYLSTALLAILATYSRAALGAFVVVFLASAYIKYGKSISKRAKAWSAFIVGIVVVTVFLLALSWRPLSLLVFHAEPGKALTESSTSDHFIYPYEAAVDLLDQPFGYGLGSAGPASFYGSSSRVVENYYIQIGLEVGGIGAILFVGIIATVAWRLHKTSSKSLTVSLLALSLMSLLLHTWTDTATSWTWWLFAGVSLAALPGSSDKRPE